MSRLLPFLILILFFVELQAQENKESGQNPNIATDRPGFSEASSLVGQGNFQIESGFNYQSDKDSVFDNKSITYNTSLLRYGLSKNFELRVIVEYLKNKSTNRASEAKTEIYGTNALCLGSKILVKEADGLIPSISFQCYMMLPYLGKEEFKPKHIAPSFRISACQSISEKFSMTYNLGGKWDGNSPGTTGFYTLSAGYSIHSKLGCFAEVYGFMPDEGPSNHVFDSGIIYLVNPNLQVDFSGGIGITDGAPDGFFAFGLSYKINRNNYK